jgi:hypothetical protein
MLSDASTDRSPGRTQRHYQAPRLGVWYGRGFLVFCALVGLLAVLDNHGAIPSPAIAMALSGCLGAIWVWAERLWGRAGLYETDEGLKIVHSFGSTTVRWESIERFEASLRSPKGRVRMIGKNGASGLVVGTAQGSRIVWDDGETRDIVGELNRRLTARLS